MEPEVRLWTAVLLQALDDLKSSDRDVRGSAIEFILSDECKEICTTTDLNHENVKKQMWESL
jgi:hypothetical protein